MGRNGGSVLTNNDFYLFLEIAEACHSLTSLDFTATIYPKLRELLPHEGFMCAAVHPTNGRVLQYFNISFPQHYLEHCDRIGTSLHCALVKKWIRVGRPVFHEKDSLSAHNDRNPARIGRSESLLYNVALHGVVNGPRRHASCYVFSNLQDAWHPRQTLILKLVTPHLHTLFLPALRGESPGLALRRPLSKREHEVLDALMAGKTGAEIARQLTISKSTVRVHIRHILDKFNANSIVGAVAKAHQTGLVARKPEMARADAVVEKTHIYARRAGP